MNNQSDVIYEILNIINMEGGLSDKEEAFYIKYIEPLSEEINTRDTGNRVITKETTLISVLIIQILAVFSIFYYQVSVLEARRTIEALVIGLGLFFILERLVAKKKRQEHIKQYKNKLIPKMLNYLEGDYYYPTTTYDFEGELKERIKPFCLTPSYNQLVTNFFLQGTCKNITFTMQEAKQVRVDKNDNITTVFEGLLFVFKTTKKFSSKTIVSRKGKKLPKSAKQMPRVILEDPEFNSLFSVYSDSQVESRIFLTPAFMCRLISLEKILNSKIDCSFYSGELLIRVPTWWKYFLIDGKNPRNDFMTIISEMQIVSEIIEGLKLELDTA